jgi:hypothetical protein
MKPWRIRTAASDRIDLVFEPEYDHATKSGNRETWYTEAHQRYGRYNGRITPDGAPAIELRDLWGWSEEHDARW